jgi:hypothetical protein
MTVVTIAVDVEALGRAASEDYAHAVQFVREDLGFGLQSERNVAKGLTYPLKRLRGLSLITEAEEAQLGELIEAVSQNADVTALVEALESASPVAGALAQLIGGSHPGPIDRMSLVAGAIAGAYLGMTMRAFSSPGLPREANQDGERLDSAISIMAAVGGALAASAFSLIELFERSQHPNNP